MSGKRKPPSAGSVFGVPLRDSGFATGVLARSTGDGKCLGYFFGPRIADANEADLSSLAPSDTVLVGMFGDLDLLQGKWPLLGELGHWVPGDWPVPQMARVDESANRAWLSTYDDDLRCVKEEEITPQQAKHYPYDRMMGSGAVEIRLTKLLNQS